MSLEAEADMTLELPDPCLELILQLLVPDSRSIYSAARAHSRLQAAAAAVQRSIKACNIPHHQQHKLEGLLLYLRKYAQHVTSLKFDEVEMLHELPTCPKVQELHLLSSRVQLGSGSSNSADGGGSSSSSSSSSCSFSDLSSSNDHRPGVLQAVPQLTLLDVQGCTLYDSSASVIAALAQLPSLHHLRFPGKGLPAFSPPGVASIQSVLSKLTHLTVDEDSGPDGSYFSGGVLRQCAPRLQQLHLNVGVMLSDLFGLKQLTLLDLSSAIANVAAPYSVVLYLAALICVSQLQHLQLYDVEAGYERFSPVLSRIGRLSQLTYLSLTHSMHMCDSLAPWLGNIIRYSMPGSFPAAEDFTALTASSRLAHLRISNWLVPDGGWGYIFQPGLQLKSLQRLFIDCDSCAQLSHADLGRMVTSCPNLQQLLLFQSESHGEPVQLQPLLSLSRLTRLAVSAVDPAVLPQLTSLQDLTVESITKPELLQLSGLQQLTSFAGELTWPSGDRGAMWQNCSQWCPPAELVFQGGSQDLSVQQQILQHCKDSDNADVREEATLSLEAVQPQADDVGRLGQQLAEQQLG